MHLDFNVTIEFLEVISAVQLTQLICRAMVHSLLVTNIVLLQLAGVFK